MKTIIPTKGRTIEEIHADIAKALEAEGLGDGYLSCHLMGVMPDSLNIEWSVVAGGVEGEYYIHGRAILDDFGSSALLFWARVLRGLDHAWLTARKCSELFERGK